MFSSQIFNREILFAIYRDKRTVFRFIDIALLATETNFLSLNRKLNYHVNRGKLLNPRKGIYAKPEYNPEELACLVYTPSYISLEYILQKSGVIFQYDSGITAISYLSRRITIDDRTFLFHKVKGEILVNTAGIIRHDNHVNVASAERAFLDLMYLNTEYYFDNLNPLSKKTLYKLLPIYQSNALTNRVKRIFKNA
jgi:hypothetical protein